LVQTLTWESFHHIILQHAKKKGSMAGLASINIKFKADLTGFSSAKNSRQIDAAEKIPKLDGQCPRL
jgi:hypothetical protein